MKLVKIHFVSILHFYEMLKLDKKRNDFHWNNKTTYISHCQMEKHLQIHQDTIYNR